ncbi:MAG: phosphoribosylformylglycinamidine synthase [Clostridiales bacterium]|mgnify:CR=1 FL=1|jgi:phosphoribosylformylglycinamidine synthase|nr:phosphoribosylformylglycinamidine synthase [Clostridiales bacterium]
MIYRLFTEKKKGFDIAAQKLKEDIKSMLGIELEELRLLKRYDVQGLSREDFKKAKHAVFSEPPCDEAYEEEVDLSGYKVFAMEYLLGQYDQRADSAEQCVQLLTRKERPKIRCASVYALKGADEEQLERIKKYLINPVEAQEASLEKPSSLELKVGKARDVEVVKGFSSMDDGQIAAFHEREGFAMSLADLEFVRDYFKSEGRDPTETELKVIDTYWSDHCRHTTFLTELLEIEIDGGEEIKKAYELYRKLFREINGDNPKKYPCLMDIATIGAKKLRLSGRLEDLDVSDEINACSIRVTAEVDGREEEWLVMFKNETHNHPTEIEPFGGAATCLGGAIRDPLSGRSYVYQAMRVTGSADPLAPIENTLPGKLPQRVITTTAAAGFSSYGNQIGLATGIVAEIYHQNYVAKRLEAGFVVGAAPKENVYRERPRPSDLVILLGGDTGRDGCGGATSSSKAHTTSSVEQCGSEVQKGNPLTERKIQRLFKKGEVTRLIKKCNDFGAGGVSVAIGELADSLLIDLSAVPKKYEGLSGTELAISESQERMAVVTSAEDAQKFIDAAREENLNATVVAKVTDTGRLQMAFEGRIIVDISRDFLSTNGAKQYARAKVVERSANYNFSPNSQIQRCLKDKDYKGALLKELSRLNVCSQKGLCQIFDSTIGAASVYMPYGGKYQLTPAIAMAAKLPARGQTDDCTVASFTLYPHFMENNPFAGSIYSVVGSVAKLIACGAARERIRLSLQEYFMRLRNDPLRWGQPVAALLGALYAQMGLEVPSIGGKDSMSGSFENLDVPPTLISFALAPAKASRLISNVITSFGKKLYLLRPDFNAEGICDFERLKALYDKVHENILSKNITFATVTDEGGAACAAVKSCLGNKIGFKFAENLSDRELFAPLIGSLIIGANDISPFEDYNCTYLGESVAEPFFKINGQKIPMEEAERAFCSTLESVFPSRAKWEGKDKNAHFEVKEKAKCKVRFGSPRVFIPVFPGTNCEYDTARRFEEEGAIVNSLVIRNSSPREIEESVRQMARMIEESQIIAFPGGFSGGGEPDGSGKFIAVTLSNPIIAESIHELLYNRDGLIIGICNGFQALIKTGLVPYGRVQKQAEGSPTLTFNNISRHVSAIVKIRVASNKSPWLYGVRPGECYYVAVSHGEGRFVCSPEEYRRLEEDGQIATQYADFDENATMESPFNPNGSFMAVEGITSPCGRVFGKMGHSERIGSGLYKNFGAEFEQFDMRIFRSGVKYFK